MRTRSDTAIDLNTNPSSDSLHPHPITRRRLLQQAAGVAAAAGALGWTQFGCASNSASAARSKGPAVSQGRINQSIVHWCFETAGEKWDVEKTCQVAKQLGCKSVELVAAEHYPVIQKHGLTNAICQINMNPDPPFLKGFNNPDHWPRVLKATTDAIDAAAAFGFPSVICFTGYAAKNPGDPASPLIPPDEGAKNCVDGLKRIIGYAEQKKVTLCMEMLNSRETTHPMKGHPGYQGDHTDYCIDIIKRVGSPRMKLLFDIYHVQIMDGDIIRRLRQLKDYIGHVHTAGNPGRGELDNKQEINYPPIMQTLLEIGYAGYVGQEFIPTRDPYQGLFEAVSLCDV
ncbi:MAG: TIM barrel protein [Verrucomicrobia bacterium]|nr:TIM barrel protein [Verrucomicrobiota bacterium]